MTKYDPLYEFLKRRSSPEIKLKMSDIERMIGESLPRSAKTYNAWWANEENPKSSHVQCEAWRDAGYGAFPDFRSGTVTFRRR
jgi:hypothetical protein